MNTLKAIQARKSYRGPYLPNPVPREDLIKILEAGCAAPSGCNKQTTSFIAVDDPEILKKVQPDHRFHHFQNLSCHDLHSHPEDHRLR